MGILRRKPKGVRKMAARFDELQSDLDALRRDAKQLVNGVGEVASSAADAAEQAYSNGRQWTAGNVGSVRSSVRGQPLTACLVSLGAGAILGALFLRR